MRQLGIVYIVGAGPGKAGLITIKGLGRLRESDVIVHDRLVHPDLLREARAGAEIIDAGKQPGKSHQMQAWIHTVLIARAGLGHKVCRLKGGDPFVFGRGGEEARVLATAGIPFEVVPGVSSISAVPASAGIPLTHRDHAHGFMVITACHASGDSGNLNLAANLIQSGGTLVILMGLAGLNRIASTLRNSGCAHSTPIAVISNGTLFNEESRIATLHDIADKASDLRSPAIIVIGSVVAANFSI